MSWPSKWMVPALGAISPASCPISVVLPAPFGPMMACSSPLATSSRTLSEATTPPKRLVRPSILSSVSAMAFAPLWRRQQAVDAAARKQHDQQEHRSENELPVFPRTLDLVAGQDLAGDADQRRQRLLQNEQRDSADHRSEHGAHAAQHHHDDARIDQPPDQIDARKQEREAQVVEQRLVRQVDRIEELAALVDRQ